MSSLKIPLMFVAGFSALSLFAATRTLQKSIAKVDNKYPTTWSEMNGVGYWAAEAGSDEDKLESGYAYAIPNKLQFSTPQATSGTLPFPGDSLILAEGSSMVVRHYGSRVEFGGDGMTINTKGGILNYNGSLGNKARSKTQSFFGGRVAFQGVAASKINHANNVNVGETFDGAFIVGSDTTVELQGVTSWDPSSASKTLNSRAKRNSVELLGDTSGVEGSIVVGTNMYFVIGQNGLRNVTEVRINGNVGNRSYSASIRPSGAIQASSIDVKNMRFSDGAIETPVVDGVSKCINVTGSLAVEGVVDVYVSKAAGECSVRTRFPILTAAQKLDVDDFHFVGVYDNDDPDDFTFANPAELVVEENEETGVFTLSLDVQPIVRCILNSTYGNTASENYFCQFTNEESWSDHQLPHEGAHYVCDQKYLRGPLRDAEGEPAGVYEFPGLSLTISGTTKFYETYKEFHCQDLRLLGGAVLALWSNLKRRISGQITVSPDDSAGEARILIYQGREETIDADIRGQGTLTVGGDSSSGSPMGTVVFAGDNSAFQGKFKFYTGPRASNPVLPDWSQQFEIYVSDGRQFGGPLPERVFDAISIEDYMKLLVTNDVEVAANRGLYVKLGAELYVSAGVAATFGSGMTVEGTLVKSGRGTLAVGGSFDSQEGGNRIEVREGSVKPMSASCFDGASLNFSAGTRIVYDSAAGGDLSAFGIRFTKQGSSFAVSGGKVKVDVYSSSGEMPVDTRVRLFTGTVSECAAFAGSVEIGSCSVGRRRPAISVIPNEDGSSSVVADVKKLGFALLFR